MNKIAFKNKGNVVNLCGKRLLAIKRIVRDKWYVLNIVRGKLIIFLSNIAQKIWLQNFD